MTLLRPLLFAATAGLALAACATPPSEPTTAPPADTEETAMTCDAEKGQWAVGKLADEALVAKVKADTGSERHRVIPPNTAVTMDYREDRVNIETDAENRVISVRCG